MNAPAEDIVGSLLRKDTAAAFNISMEDVQVLGMHAVARRTLQANVSATLGVDLPAGASEEDIEAALEVQKLSADRPIEMLSTDPDTFFGRTTKTLDVGVQSTSAETVENRPSDGLGISKLALILPGSLGLVTGAALILWALMKSRRNSPLVQHARAWVRTLSFAPAAQRYTRQS